MAARKSSGSRKGAAPNPRGKKGKTLPAEKGHNSKIDRQAVKAFFDRLDNVHDAKEADNASHMADIKAIYEEAAETLDVSRGAVRDVYKEHRIELKRQEREKEMEPEKIAQRDSLRLALGSFADSPLGMAAKEREDRDAASDEMGAEGE